MRIFKFLKKKVTKFLTRDYTIASVRERSENWSSEITSPTILETEKLRARARARAFVRNNSHGAKFKILIGIKVVSKGFTPRSDNLQALALWLWWVKKAKRCDFDERNNFVGLQYLVMQAVAESGAVLVQRIWKKAPIVPFEIRVLEIDYLDTSLDGSTDTEVTKQGVIFSVRTGKRIAYNVFRHHPLDLEESSTESVRIKAKDILHIYKQERPGATDGVTWFSPFASDLKEFSDYRDAQLVKQKISACHVGMIQDMEMPDLDDVSMEDNTYNINGKLEPGAMDMLPPGKTITYNNPPTTDGDDFDFTTMKGIAAGSGFSYESFSGDFSRVNFTSGRMGQLNERAFVCFVQDTILVPQFLDAIWDWFTEAIGIMDFVEEIEVTWTAPKVPFVNPVQDINALVTEVEKGFKTHSEALRERGYDPKNFFAEIKDEQKYLKLLRREEKSGSDKK